MTFLDRLDAAEQLSVALSAYRGTHPLVLAIPRGAVPMARVVSQRLGGELDVVPVRKLRYPGSPELAMGAISASGWTYLNPDVSAAVNAQDLAKEKAYQLEVLHAREAGYFHDREPMSPQGRTVIVVDDGLATGATMRAALQAIRQHHPARLICAVPVASHEALEKIKPWVDAWVCLSVPENFHGVGQFYSDFRQVEDEDVLRILRAVALTP